MKKSIFVLIGVFLLTALLMPAITVNAAQVDPRLILTADNTVQKGTQFELIVKFEGAGENIYAQDFKIEYNADKFSFVSVDSMDKSVAILVCNSDTAGVIRIISASMNSLESTSSLYKIRFAVKDVKFGTKEQFRIIDTKLGTAQGAVIQANGNNLTVVSASDKTILLKKLDNAKLILSRVTNIDKNDLLKQLSKKALQKVVDGAIKVCEDIESDQITVDRVASQLDKAIESIGK